MIACQQHAVGRLGIFKVRSGGAWHDRVTDRIRHERVFWRLEKIEIERRLLLRPRLCADVLPFGEEREALAEFIAAEHVDEVAFEAGKQVTLVTVHRCA